MSESYSSKWVFKSTAAQVSKLMQLDENTPEPWSPDDLTMMVRHQMESPLEFDLPGMQLSAAERELARESINQAAQSSVKTFGDLFRAEKPPLDLLKLVQKFFKSRVPAPNTSNPEQKVAFVLYLVSIAVARLRTGVNTTRMPDAKVKHNVQSVLSWPWLAPEIRAILTQSQGLFSG